MSAKAVDRVGSSGIASSGVLLTIVALGAGAGLVATEPEYAAPAPVVHRAPPGPAQIEFFEADLSARAVADPEPIALFGVDVASAISVACGGTRGPEPVTLESVVCELAAQAMKRIPGGTSEYTSLLLLDG